MTKVEFALIMRIIDCHTKMYANPHYQGSEEKSIRDVDALKADLKRCYDDCLKEGN